MIIAHRIERMKAQQKAPTPPQGPVDKFGRFFASNLHMVTKGGKPRLSKNGILYCKPKK